MKQKNGFVQIKITNSIAELYIYPPEDEGLPVTVKDVENYLSKEGFLGWNREAIDDAIKSGKATYIILGSVSYPRLSGLLLTVIKDDHMSAVSRAYPPSDDSNAFTVDDIMDALKADGVTYGIDKDKVQEFVKNPVYMTDIEFATGKKVRQGHDAKIEYYFNTHPTLKPRENENGTVDYHDLSIINEVRKGDLVAKVIPADRGEAGYDVSGHPITPSPVKLRQLEPGPNIILSEDRMEAYSGVTGHVMLKNGKIFISDVYNIPANVDNSTGDIHYSGNVHIKGNVRGGFQVTAEGDVIVDGVVEDAYIQSGGQIIIGHGLHGNGRGILEAEGNIACKFIESGKIFSKGSVAAESIINSEVQAYENVNVTTKKGLIAGGVIKAGGDVNARYIGTEMGAQTIIESGTNPDKKTEMDQLTKETNDAQSQLDKLMPVLDAYKNLINAGKKLDKKNAEYARKVAAAVIDAQNKITNNKPKIDELKELLNSAVNSSVSVSGSIYPGTTIVMSKIIRHIEKVYTHTRFSFQDGEIKANVF
jgi:uncharacterized protein (DUF342 family)